MGGKLFKLVERNIRRSLRRTILTTLTVALATFVFTVLVSVPASMDRIISDASSTLRLVINNKTAPWYDLPARYCDQIRAMPGCAACVAITGWPATWRNVSEPVFAAAAGPEIGAVFPDYALTAVQQQAIGKERRAAIVGEVLMKKYGWKMGQQITLRSADPPEMDLTFVVMGVMTSQHYPNTFLINRGYLMEAYRAHGNPDADFAWQLMVRADSSDHLAMLSKEIDEHFANSDAETRSETESDMLSTGLSSLGNVRGIIFSLCAIVILTVMLIAANSTAMMVRERISEVAVMRALGFSRGAISMLLFGECAIIGIVGGAIGAGLAYRLFSAGATLGPVLNGLGALYVMGEQAAIGFGAAVFVSVVSGLIPIVGALRITPALAFRKVI
ncbi:MAG: ABC transporter permease [Candidatus Binataceae bacterium]